MPTVEVKFYGSSDDLFQVEGPVIGAPDEIGCYDKPGVIKVQSGVDQVCVVAMYSPGNVSGCWSIGLMPVDEDVPIPSWPMNWKLKDHHGYSTELVMTVPDNAVVSVVSDER